MNYGTFGLLLTKLKTNGPTEPDCGICTNLLDVADQHFDEEAERYGRGRILRALAIVFSAIGLDGSDPAQFRTQRVWSLVKLITLLSGQRTVACGLPRSHTGRHVGKCWMTRLRIALLNRKTLKLYEVKG